MDDDEATQKLCAKRSGLRKLRIYKIKAERDSGKRRFAQVLFGVELLCVQQIQKFVTKSKVTLLLREALH